MEMQDKKQEADIAYCAPVMNRFSDIQKTLAHNLAVLKKFTGRAQLIIACFDADTTCQDWVEKNFADEIETGLLKFHALPPLPHWHFSWAKNAFSDLIEARYYSSLDGDNFLSENDIEKTLSLISNLEQEYLIHHFSGTWGDGTSGRITIPAHIYRQAPYINELMPRQFDEIGVILRLLTGYPHLVFASRPGVNIFDRSNWCREYLDLNGIAVNHQEIDLGVTGNPLNPRNEDYIDKDEKIHFYHKLNAAYTFWKISVSDSARQKFSAFLESAQRAYTRTRSCVENMDALFGGEAINRLKKTGEVTLYAVNRNNYSLLKPWIAHYRALGVERFIIVDDGSDPPLSDILEGDDIHVVYPYFGIFRSSKVFWLKALMTAFQEAGSWVLTVDVDEFLDLEAPAASHPETSKPLRNYLSAADRHGWDYAAGILLDMMPAKEAKAITSDNFLESMDSYYFRPVNASYEYQNLTPVQWAFGDFWPISFVVDIRYRLYGTIDCLRKIPLVRFYPEIDLNQGFHALLRNERTLTWQELLIPERGLLPIRHYKMNKVFSAVNAGAALLERGEQYFDRTRKNLNRIAESDLDYIIRSWYATPFKRRYTGPLEFPFYKGFQRRKSPDV
jgi:hypothetical protein